MFKPKHFFAFLVILYSFYIISETRPPIKDKINPLLGIYITDIYDFDYAKNTFHVSGYLWINYKDPIYTPKNSIEIINSMTLKEKINYLDRRENNFLYGERFFATVFHQWDMSNFPFDTQLLEIYIEDGWYDNNSVEFIVDEENSGLDESVQILGWQLKNFNIKANPHNYNSTFGEINGEKNTFSRVTAEITIKRDWVRPFINYFISFFLAVFLSIIAVIINPSEIGSKFSLTLAAIFAVVGNKYILDAVLPITTGYSLVDKIEMSTFMFVIITVIFNYFEMYLHMRNKDYVRNKILFLFLPASIVLYIAYILYSVLTSN